MSKAPTESSVGAFELGSRWRRHYLIEALEKRYNTWARLCSWHRPRYAFDVGGNRHVVACLDGASPDYRTVIAVCATPAFRLVRIMRFSAETPLTEKC